MFLCLIIAIAAGMAVLCGNTLLGVFLILLAIFTKLIYQEVVDWWDEDKRLLIGLMILGVIIVMDGNH